MVSNKAKENERLLPSMYHICEDTPHFPDSNPFIPKILHSVHLYQEYFQIKSFLFKK